MRAQHKRRMRLWNRGSIDLHVHPDPIPRSDGPNRPRPQGCAPLVRTRPAVFGESAASITWDEKPRRDTTPSPHPRRRAPRPPSAAQPLPAARGAAPLPERVLATILHKSLPPRQRRPTPLILPQHTHRRAASAYLSSDQAHLHPAQHPFCVVSGAPCWAAREFRVLCDRRRLHASMASSRAREGPRDGRRRARAARRPSLFAVGRQAPLLGAPGAGRWVCSAASGLRLASKPRRRRWIDCILLVLSGSVTSHVSDLDLIRSRDLPLFSLPVRRRGSTMAARETWQRWDGAARRTVNAGSHCRLAQQIIPGSPPAPPQSTAQARRPGTITRYARRRAT